MEKKQEQTDGHTYMYTYIQVMNENGHKTKAVLRKS